MCMDERPIGRNVIARHRFARLFSLGDRRNPKSWSPGLILSKEDPELPESIAPLVYTRNNHDIPARSDLSTRSHLCYPFDSIDQWNFNEGLVLPPSLVDSDSGEFGEGSEVLPISWSSLHHDERIANMDAQPSVVVLTDSPQLAKLTGMLENALISIRTKFPASLIWTPGIAGPDNCALLAWMGVDLFDLSRSRQASSLGVLITESGPRSPDNDSEEDSSMISQCSEWSRAISSVRVAIRQGSLRELAERNSTSSANSVVHLRTHDLLSRDISERRGLLSSSENSGRKLRCYSFESRNDPVVKYWRHRVSELHEPPEHQRQVLVLLPCSAKKPYKLSQSHARFRRSLKNHLIHEVMVTAPLGLVPRELEELWPAAHYDIPVSGIWDADELLTIRAMISRVVERVRYSIVINHSGIDLLLDGIRVVDTRQGDSAGSIEALSRLKNEVETAFNDLPNVEFAERPRLMQLKAISRFLLGSDSWLDGAEIRGRPPIITINRDGIQIAKWNPRRGMFSFSKASLRILEKLEVLNRVNLKADVNWLGDIFPSYIEDFDPVIRTGDELLVYQESRLIGSARATAPGWEWPHGPGRLAKARHRL